MPRIKTPDKLKFSNSKRFTDQMGRKLELPHWPPRRIVSVVPSQTEFLADLGLGERVVGITKFCVHPRKWFEEKPRVGGTKTLDFQKIDALQPDLIVGNKEENEQGQIEFLSRKYPVWMSDVASLEDALAMMKNLGALTGKSDVSDKLIAEIIGQFTHLGSIAQRPMLRVAYLIWRKPYMAAASGTFINDMLARAGFENAFSRAARYPEISKDELRDARPDLIFLSSEPFPFFEKHFPEFLEICPEARIRLVDGEMFSWYGSRLLFAPRYFENLLRTLI